MYVISLDFLSERRVVCHFPLRLCSAVVGIAGATTWVCWLCSRAVLRCSGAKVGDLWLCSALVPCQPYFRSTQRLSRCLPALHHSTSLSALYRSTQRLSRCLPALLPVHATPVSFRPALLPLHATSVSFRPALLPVHATSVSFPGRTGFLFFLWGRPELLASVILFACHVSCYSERQKERERGKEGDRERETLDVNVLSTALGPLRTKKEKGGRRWEVAGWEGEGGREQ